MNIRSLIFVCALSLPAFSQANQTNSPAQQPSASDNPVGVYATEPAATAPPANPQPDPSLDLTPDAKGKLSQQQMQNLLRVVAEKDLANDKRLRDYTYLERETENRIDGKGQVKSTEVKTYDILEIYGEQVQRLTGKDDKPLPEKDAAKEEEKIQKIIDKRKNESDNDRKKREEKAEKDREDERAFVRDAADAYSFTLVGTETIEGREAWVIDGEPRAGFVPRVKEGKYLSKFHGRVWIDKADLQLAKLDVECLDTISWGLFLARFHKGTHFMLEQTRVNDEVWLPRHVTAKLDVRLALLKNFDVEIDQTYRDYKKFRTSSKIVGVAEVK